MPLSAEQPDNIMRAQDRGYAVSVNVKKLNTLAQDIQKALKRVINEGSFSENAARVSHIMRAHRQTPAEIAVGRFSCFLYLV